MRKVRALDVRALGVRARGVRAFGVRALGVRAFGVGGLGVRAFGVRVLGVGARDARAADVAAAVPKPRVENGLAHKDELPGEPTNRGVVTVPAQLQIIGRRLPGSSWSGRSGIHIGVQRDNEVIGLVTGDAADAVFNIDLDIVADAEGAPDFSGPYVHGRRGERFVYLSWGEVGEDGSFAMFRRLKLHLAPLVEQASAEKVLAAKRIQAVLELTDTRGRPLAASVRPPWVTWRLGTASTVPSSRRASDDLFRASEHRQRAEAISRD